MNQPSGSTSTFSPAKKTKTSPGDDASNKYVENAKFVNPELRGEKEKPFLGGVSINKKNIEDDDSISLLATER